MASPRGSEYDRFSALYAEHYAAVLRYAARRVGAETARDIAAETFMTAWRRLSHVPPAQPLPWLYATARRCLANELRRKQYRDQLDSRMRAEATRSPDAGGPELSEQMASRLALLAALAALRPQDQEALRLIEWEQLDAAAAAAVLGCSAGAFKVRLHRARRRLARALDQQAAEAPSSAPSTATPLGPARTEIDHEDHDRRSRPVDAG